jgi:hypothetical protein
MKPNFYFIFATNTCQGGTPQSKTQVHVKGTKVIAKTQRHNGVGEKLR